MDLVLFVVGLVVGLFVGWHVPQPPWVQKVEEKVKEKL